MAPLDLSRFLAYAEGHQAPQKERDMGRIISLAILLGIVGLGVGYLIFGRVGGEFIPIEALLQSPDNIIAQLGDKITGVSEARQNILISGGVGLGLGVLAGAVRR
jgi:hypothetical protein